MLVYQDTREKIKVQFPGSIRVERKTLKVGDYSYHGGLGDTAVEVKRARDLYSCLMSSKERRRLHAQIGGLMTKDFRLLLVVGTWPLPYQEVLNVFGPEWAREWTAVKRRMYRLQHLVPMLQCTKDEAGKFILSFFETVKAFKNGELR